MVSRRVFLKLGALAGAGVLLAPKLRYAPVFASPSVSVLQPGSIPKFVTPLIIPPPMPRTSVVADGTVDYYEIAVRQFQQDILPPQMGLAPTTVWSYGSANHPGTFNYPAFTIEAKYGRPVRVKWINGLVDTNGQYLPHLLPVDQTLHWANPPGGLQHRDGHGHEPTPYRGPVPIVTHVHGAHTTDESDGYTEAWYLPAANNIPASYASEGTWYQHFKNRVHEKYGVTWEPGAAVFQYPNRQRASTLWYHDHTLGMTRLNVYAGPAGFYLVREGPDDQVTGILPKPAPGYSEGPVFEIPIAIQDRSFNEDGSLFYPDNRAFFEDLDPDQLQIPFIPDTACGGQPSDVSPIWNPEFFGDVMVVNGRSWPYLRVEQRRYRFRLLNGCNARFLILSLSNGMPFYQIGADGGFLPAPVARDQLLMAPAERADVIVNFTNVPVGNTVILRNLGPDEPFGGGVPGEDFEPADPNSTGQVMLFQVAAATSVDLSTPPSQLRLPERTPLEPPDRTRAVTLNELESETVLASEEEGNVVLDCSSGSPFGPIAATLGILDSSGNAVPLLWSDNVTEVVQLGQTEVWEIYNLTVDAHPIHIHEVMFEVVNREMIETGAVRPPEAWELGVKDTVIAYPGEITRVKANFDLPGRYVWHCHIVEHEDNEMMRPLDVVSSKIWIPSVRN